MFSIQPVLAAGLSGVLITMRSNQLKAISSNKRGCEKAIALILNKRVKYLNKQGLLRGVKRSYSNREEVAEDGKS